MIYAKVRKVLNIARGFNHGMRIVQSPQSFFKLCVFLFLLIWLAAKYARNYAKARKGLNVARGFNHGMRIVQSPQSFFKLCGFFVFTYMV